MCNNSNITAIYIIRVSEREVKERGDKRVFEKLMAEILLNSAKYIEPTDYRKGRTTWAEILLKEFIHMAT